jgi:hypothetical protein
MDELRAELEDASAALRAHPASWPYAFATAGGCHGGSEHPALRAVRDERSPARPLPRPRDAARRADLTAPDLVGQLGDPSAQVSGALADRDAVGVRPDAAAVAHREGVLPGRKKRPEFLSKLVQVVHGLSHLSVARVASSAPRLSY